MTLQVNPIASSPAGIRHFSEQYDERWMVAIDCVNYPVMLKPLHYHHDDEEMRAAGVTNTGRDSEFFGVVVDRNRTDDLSTISVVTGLYDTLPAADVYLALKKDIEEAGMKAMPARIYVSGNGGRHELNLLLPDMEWVDNSHEVEFNLVVNTSVDGSSKHSIRVAAIDAETGAEILGIGTTSMNLSAKHTRTIKERHAAFTVVVDSLLKEWNETIIPSLQLFNGCVFDKAYALELFEGILEDSNIPERHQERALAWYTGQNYSEHSLYGVLHGISSYLEEDLKDKPERLTVLKDQINKRSKKIIEKVLRKHEEENIG